MATTVYVEKMTVLFNMSRSLIVEKTVFWKMQN